jgi:hypothetical protein
MQARPPKICPHLIPGPYPFDSALVLDDHLGPTDWLIRCRSCATAYLLEMLDWDGARRLYRMRVPEPQAVDRLLRDLDRGSCDLSRARDQAHHFSLTSTRLAQLALLDLAAGELIEVLEIPEGTAIPGASWRELPCDGSWVQRLG